MVKRYGIGTVYAIWVSFCDTADEFEWAEGIIAAATKCTNEFSTLFL